MILYRCFAWDESADATGPDGPLWYPRPFQGEGRHDNPPLFGCLYLADRAVSCVVEQLARFRGQRLTAALLRRRNLPLAIAEIELADAAELVDLDDPATLRREKLRPSVVATRHREITQLQAATLHAKYPRTAGLRWWSTYESLWMHVTVFDRAAQALRLNAVRVLTLEDSAIVEASERFGMHVR